MATNIYLYTMIKGRINQLLAGVNVGVKYTVSSQFSFHFETIFESSVINLNLDLKSMFQ